MLTITTIRQRFALLSKNTYRRVKPVARFSWTVLMTLSMLMTSIGVGPSQAAPAANIVGQGFTVTPADLAFILKQIKIAEAHVANTTSLTGPCGALLGSGPDQLPSPLLSFGLRTVDGTCNNLQPGQETFGAADQTFPRLSTPVFETAEDSTVPGIGPVGAPGLTSYAQTGGSVVDSEPRMISNLIVDQTSTNPAAIAAAGFPVRSQGNEGVVPCTTEPTTPGGTDGLPLGCVPQYETLFIPNVTTDVGLSPPFNSMFTIFGQFFDHGLDKITNGGNGVVFVPLQADDPLIAGDNHIFGDGDDLPANARFMVVTRGHIVTGADGFRNAPNTDTPFVDQSQTYTSHSSHQIFLREYVNNTAGRPVSTGKFLSTADGGLATWAMIKNQAATMLGLQLVDANVGNIPMIASDPYGKFIPGDLRGLPQYVTTTGLVEGDTAAPVAVPANAIFINTAFLNDIAHSAAPTAGGPDDDGTAGGSLDATVPAGSYDNELLDLHAICGDGRCNENIALQAVHQVFHTEHDRLVDYIENVLTTDTSGVTNLADWQLALGANGWNGERLFQAARFVTEMEYQHLVFEEFARKVQPAINPFEPFAFNQTDVDPAITAEFAHAVYRFGHSMLTEDIARTNADGSNNDIPLFNGFLNPAEYYNGGTAGLLTSQEAAGSIFMGMSDQTGNEIDEFVTDVLRNHLVGLPLDLAAINMTRARSEGIPSLNNFRKQVFVATNDGQLRPYTDWIDFGLALKHPESLVNFIAAYGKHPTITSQTTLEGRRAAADQILNGTTLPGPDGELFDNPATFIDESLDDIPGIPADTYTDTNLNGIWDAAIPADTYTDTNLNGVWDAAIPADTYTDTNLNGVWDAAISAEPLLTDTNLNGVWDDAIPADTFTDTNGNLVWDAAVPAEPFDDLDASGTWDIGEPFTDTNGNLVWDDAIPAEPLLTDTNGNGVWDDAVPADTFADTNLNGVWDAAIPAEPLLTDTNGNGVWDDAIPAEPLLTDTNGNGVWDDAILAEPLLTDANLNGVWDDAVPASCGPDLFCGDNPATFIDESADNIFPPADSSDFVFSTGAWVNAGSSSITGVDDIDMWVGGLAEHTNLFGGLLGSTFNYVFENQMTNLQNGDRFYYLARTPGMNLRAQLEGNSFSELVMRNTNAHTLKADPFGTADCKFELGNLTFGAAGSVNDDPASECDEHAVLIRMSNGTIRYRLINSVDPAGINAQAVYNGAPNDFVDRIFGGADNDTFWGGLGNDIIEGGDGADIALGGEGNDIITDLAGDDVPKGGPGNDAIDAGPGLDIIMGGEGNDFMNGGANTNEIFAGEGNDFAIGGQGMDAVFGDSGDDWIEGGDQPDLLIGDSSSLFFDDNNLPGHDIFIGQGGDDDYDSEGGDDILVAGPGVEKNAGTAGYDWSIGLGDPQPQNADLALPLLASPPPANEVRDRFNELEALSGWNFDDILRGDSLIPSEVGGGGFIGCDALDQAGLDRIAGLDTLVPPLTTPIGPVLANSVTQHCLLTGDFVWGEGNILLGGAGSDLIEGRGGDDILDGDKYLNVRLSVTDGLVEIGSTDLMEHAAVSGNFGAGTSGMNLQQAVFAGLVDPGNIVAVREILNPGPATDVDTAKFSGPQTDYLITLNLDGSVTIEHIVGGGGGGGGGGGDDGTDTLWNIEQLEFCNEVDVLTGLCLTPVRVMLVDIPLINTVATGTVTIDNLTPTENQLLTATPAITDPDGIGTLLITWQSEITPGNWVAVGDGLTFVPQNNAVGFPLRAVASFFDGLGVLETVIGDVTASVININDVPSGAPVLSSNTPDVGVALTVDTSGIVDPDGLVGVTFNFQWQAGSTDIVGETGASFVPTSAQAGSTLRVIVSFTDNHGTPETVASADSSPVPAPLAVVSPVSLAFGLQSLGTTSVAQVITVTNTGNASLLVSGISLSGANFGEFLVTASDCGTVLPGASCTVNMVFVPTTIGAKTAAIAIIHNAAGSPSSVSLSGTGVAANVPPVGLPAVSDLTPTEAQTVSAGVAGITDANGLGVFSFQWQQNNVGGAGAFVNIAGATLSTFTPTQAQVNRRLQVVVSFTDLGGTLETVVSGQTAVVGDLFNGTNAANNFTGTAGSDNIFGNGGADDLNGAAGDDIITGGAGNDRLRGGTGLNVFVYASGAGADRIDNFDANATGGQDLIDLSALGVTAANFNARVSITAAGAHTLVTITLSGGTNITLRNRIPANFTTADFILAP